jgi:hypothetical protein
MSLVSPLLKPPSVDEGPIGSDLGQGIGGEDRVVADVVDLIEPASVLAQDHVGGCAGRRRRVWPWNGEEAVGAVAPYEDTAVVDVGYRERLVQRDVSARAVEEAVLDGPVGVMPDDLAQIVDAGRNSVGARWSIDGGVDAAAIEKAVGA